MNSKKITIKEIRYLYSKDYGLWVDDLDIKQYLKNFNSHFEYLHIDEWELKHKVVTRILSKLPELGETWLEQKIKKILFEKDESFDSSSKSFRALEKVIDILNDKSAEELDEFAKKDKSKSTYKQWLAEQEYDLKIQWKENLLQEFINAEIDYL
ncbi:hypothetical protein [Mycoplasma yeatsii]|uniref:hypothetical protein n=1 Tax=Mycoplasma yeatsii TaxID=51365 RepID=UPI0005B24617|nr:hypothetical protein [Mycoplasma yeatsii]AJM71550.1 hypothetical protein MYE_00265 [Mycoplasma yeatsii GM274B]